jgi:hypothetical protein
MSHAPLLPSLPLDFTGMNPQDMLVRLQALFTQLNPEWDDYSVSYPENLLLEGMVHIADLIRGATEERVRQLVWPTLTAPIAAARLAQINGYSLSGATPSYVTLTVTTRTGAGVAARLEIPTTFEARVVDGGVTKRYRPSAPIVFAAGEATKSAVFEQTDQINNLFESLEEPNMELVLDQGLYVAGSLAVTASNGAFTEVSNFTGQGPNDRVFRQLLDDEYKPRVRFGNGINGAVPTGSIDVSYKVTLGERGEVGSGAPWQLDIPVDDDRGNQTYFNATNAEESSTASDPITVDEARVLAPLSMRTIGDPPRLVVDYDYEFRALENGAIARAFLATSNSEPTIAENRGVLLVVGFGDLSSSNHYAPAQPTSAVIAAVQESITEAGGAYPGQNFETTVQAAELFDVAVSVKVYLDGTVQPAATAVNVRTALEDLFAVAELVEQAEGTKAKVVNEQTDFGARLAKNTNQTQNIFAWSDVFQAIVTASGVSRVAPASDDLLLNGIRSDLFVPSLSFPRLTSVTIFDETNGGQI